MCCVKAAGGTSSSFWNTLKQQGDQRSRGFLIMLIQLYFNILLKMIMKVYLTLLPSTRPMTTIIISYRHILGYFEDYDVIGSTKSDIFLEIGGSVGELNWSHGQWR